MHRFLFQWCNVLTNELLHKKKTNPCGWFFFLLAKRTLCSTTFEVMSPSALCAQRANNLQPKEKRLIIVFSTVDTAEQEVGRAECTEAIGDAYANGAVGREERCNFRFAACWGNEKSHSRNQIRNSRLIQSYRPTVFFLSLNINRKSLVYKGFFSFVVHFGICGAYILYR